jgi:hypothetical protein
MTSMNGRARELVTLTARQEAALTAAAIGLTGEAAARRLGAANLTHAVTLATAYGLLDLTRREHRPLPDYSWSAAETPRPTSISGTERWLSNAGRATGGRR